MIPTMAITIPRRPPKSDRLPVGMVIAIARNLIGISSESRSPSPRNGDRHRSEYALGGHALKLLHSTLRLNLVWRFLHSDSPFLGKRELLLAYQGCERGVATFYNLPGIPVQTTERYIGSKQKFQDAVNDRLGLSVARDKA